ncbi:MAG: ASCH domain-containing protein [Firmicutes bacterium]|nr:ASCH domain-containing protein [Bacillota bacterium]
MRVLSIKEPYASLIKAGIKKIETRSFKTNYRGELYIHASQTKMKCSSDIERMLNLINPMPGYILCKCILKDCIYMDESFISSVKQTDEYRYGYYEVGRYAWILENIEKIAPVLAKGKLGIWYYQEERGSKK